MIRVHPIFLRDLMLLIVFGVAWFSVPRAKLLDRQVHYQGQFRILDGRTLVDSLGQRWHLSKPLSSGAYRGNVTFYPFEDLELPFVFSSKMVYGAKDMLGEARLGEVQCSSEAEQSKLVLAWNLKVDSLPWSSSAKALVQALVLGKARDLPPEIRGGLQRLGLAHLTAVSGFHLGLLWGLIAGSMRILPWPWRPRARIMGLALLWGYVALIGYPLSAVRAAVMISFLAVLNLGERRKTGMRTLVWTVAGMLLYQPAWLKDVGFQLSVSAVAGIILWMGLPMSPWQKTSGLSAAAQFSTLWVAWPTFHQWPWFFWPANLFLTPVILMLYPYTAMAIVGQAFGWFLPFPEWALNALAAVPEDWVLTGGYLSDSGRWALRISVLGGLYGAYKKWWVLSFMGILAAGMLLAESGPWKTQERTWHQQGRGLAQVEIRVDTALIQGTKGFLAQSYYWERRLEGYFQSRGVKYYQYVPLAYPALPEDLRQWGDSTQSKVLWRLPRRKKRTSATD